MAVAVSEKFQDEEPPKTKLVAQQGSEFLLERGSSHCLPLSEPWHGLLKQLMCTILGLHHRDLTPVGN